YRIGADRNAPAALIEKLKEMGAKVVDLGPRPRVPQAMNSLDPEEAAAFEGDLASGALGDVDTNYGLGGAGRGGRVTAGRAVSAVDFLKVQRHRAILQQAMGKFMAELDLYVTTTDLGDVTLASMTGHPAVVLPTSFGRPPRGRGDAPEQPNCTVITGNLF